MTNVIPDPKILNKNLEITRILKDLDTLQSDYVDLKHETGQLQDEIVRLTLKNDKDEGYSQSLGDDEFNPNSRGQTPMYMINTLEECYNNCPQYWTEELKKDLRNVIKFLKE